MLLCVLHVRLLPPTQQKINRFSHTATITVTSFFIMILIATTFTLFNRTCNALRRASHTVLLLDASIGNCCRCCSRCPSEAAAIDHMLLLLLGTTMHQMQIIVTAATATAGLTAADAAAQFDTASLAQWIVFLSIIIGIEELLEPLQELEIVLETSLNKLINWYYLPFFCCCCYRCIVDL